MVDEVQLRIKKAVMDQLVTPLLTEIAVREQRIVELEHRIKELDRDNTTLLEELTMYRASNGELWKQIEELEKHIEELEALV